MTARRKLVRNFPWFTRYRRELALGLSSLGDVYLEMNRHNDARQAFNEAWQTQQELAKKHPEILDFAVDLAGSCVSQGRLALELDDYPAALDFYLEAQKISNNVLEKRPHDYRALRYLKAAETGCEELRERHRDQMAVKV
jgi:tetratricopeptide (TPR) repeat protein